MKSILQKEKECYACHTTIGLEKHHCIYGTANRAKADNFGLTVWLCNRHHTGADGVHAGNKKLDIELKQLAQREFEKRYSHEKFMATFHKNYL